MKTALHSAQCSHRAPARASSWPRPTHQPSRSSFKATCAMPAFRMSQPGVNRVAPCPKPAPFASASYSSRSRRQVVVQANWGAPVDFKSAKVVSNTSVTPGMHLLVINCGDVLAASYTKPGQYVQAKDKADSKAGFFAIANAPGKGAPGTLELLIKSQPGSTAESLTKLAPGAEVLLSAAQGKGYPVDKIPAANFPTVLMFATGSGISPIKAVIESGVLGKRSEVRLYYGTRSPETTAFKDLIPQWQSHGIKVTQVYSGNEKKYIQDVFSKEAGALASPKQVGVLLCGQKEMCQAVTGLLKEKGVEQDQILLNF